MKNVLKLSVFNKKLLEHKGLTLEGLGEKCGVSKEAVSKWLSGRSMPTDDKLMRLCVALNVDRSRILEVGDADPGNEPICHYRTKLAEPLNRETQERTERFARFMRRFSERNYRKSFLQFPILANPVRNYKFIQRVASDFRSMFGVGVIPSADDLIGCFSKFHIHLLPVFWGGKDYQGNALRIFLPSLNLTWVMLNIDSRLCDFKFWMAHELGHTLLPKTAGDFAEKFADSFAQALLYPQEFAEASYDVIRSRGDPISVCRSEAKRCGLSAYTIYRAILDYQTANPAKDKAFRASQRMAEACLCADPKDTVSKFLFGPKGESVEGYLKLAGNYFKSDFFTVLRAFARECGSMSYVGDLGLLLGLSYPDAYAIVQTLKKK